MIEITSENNLNITSYGYKLKYKTFSENLSESLTRFLAGLNGIYYLIVIKHRYILTDNFL